MLITVTTDGEQLYNLEIDNQMAIEDVKALLEAESGIPPNSQHLFFNGKELTEPKKTLEEYQVGPNEIIHLQQQQQQPQQQQQTSHPDFDIMRQHVLRDPRLLQQLENVSSFSLIVLRVNICLTLNRQILN
ncbi:ubiquitin-related domain-containing protein [Choanephora cucurbitarum]|nr:ubiquitin-related domain-containing protein [Choanephora cucurbitarum]